MIKPKYIHIQNFNNITDAELDLSSDVTLFIGENGSGKTSAVDAISLCLFEHKRSDTFADFIKSGAQYSNIYFECDIGDEPITFDIKITQSGLEREVKYKGSIYHNSEVTALLESLNLKYFGNIFCSMQNDKDITKFSPTERVQYIQKLLAFSFSQQLKAIDDNIKQFTDNITALSAANAATQQTISNLEQQIKPLNKIDERFSNIDSIKAKASELESYVLSKTAALRSNAAVSLIKDKLNSEIQSLALRLSTLNEKAAQISLSKDNIVKLEHKINEFSSIKDSLDKEYTELSQSLIKLEDYYQKENDKYQGVLSDVYSLEAKQKLCEDTIKKLDHDVCPYCGQPIKDSDKAQHVNELELIQNQLKFLYDKRDQEKKIISNISNDKVILEKSKTEKSSQINSYQYQINSCEAELACINNELASLAPISEEIDGLKMEIQEKQNLLKLEDSKLLEIDNTEWNNNQQELARCNQTLDSYKKLNEANELIKATNETIMSSIEQHKAILDENTKKYTALSDDLAVYKEGKIIFDKKLPQFIIIKTCKKIETRLNLLIQNIFPNLYIRLFYSKKGIEFFYSTSGTNEELEKDQMLPIKQASGFEKAILSVCFKSVLCEAYNIPFVILDEVDAAASEENSRKFFDIIINGGLFNQSIIISHKLDIQDTIKGMSNSIVSYLVNKGQFEVA